LKAAALCFGGIPAIVTRGQRSPAGFVVMRQIGQYNDGYHVSVRLSYALPYGGVTPARPC